MFGNLVQKLQTLSPLGSPITSPVSSPKSRRKFGGPKWRRNQNREEYREVQSDPEMDENIRNGTPRKAKDKSSRKLQRVTIGPPILLTSSRDVTVRHNETQHVGGGGGFSAYNNVIKPPAAGPNRLQGSKSLGRLDGMKEVCHSFAMNLCPDWQRY